VKADGTENARIRFTSADPTGHDRYAVIITVGQKKEEDLVAIILAGFSGTSPVLKSPVKKCR